MKALRAILILSPLLNALAIELLSESEKEICSSHFARDPNRNLDLKDCVFEKNGGDDSIRCVVSISADAPTDATQPLSSSENGTEGTNVTIHVDFGYKIAMYQLERTEDAEVPVCLYVVAISYERILEDDGKERTGFPLASRIFNVVANAEMLSSEVELMEPIFVGRGKIDRSCHSASKGNYSQCVTDLTINMMEVVPGSDEDVNEGVARFSVFAFGYSHLSYLRFTDDMQTIATFPDRTRWGKGLLRYLPGENITALRVPKNRWTYIDDSDMPNLPKLEILDLSRNSFETFETDIFDNTTLLRHLNFSESRLKKIPSFISKQPHLTVLNLGGNAFSYDIDNGALALVPVISNLTQIEVLNISGFVTRYFTNSTLPPLPNLIELDASLCKIIDVESSAFKYQPRLVKIDLSNNLLNDLPSDVFAMLKYLEYVDLSSNRFTTGQDLIFYPNKRWPMAGMQILDMSSNILNHARNVIGFGSKVKRINLASNVLRDLNDLNLNYDSDSAMVEELDLSSNLIPALSPSACETLSHVREVNLTDNQFNCDSCDLKTFQLWLNYSARGILTSEPEELLCAAPPAARKAKTRVIDAIYNLDLCRGPDYSAIFGSTISGLALAAAMLGGLLYIYRFEASYVLHLIRVRRRAVKGEGKPHSECIYDAFISYSGRDRTWVLRVLQPELEESEQKYQLCLHDRNFTLGGIITQNIVDSIDKSRKTILILSENFVESQWCRWEMEMANHKLFNDSRDFLVLIELERLDRRNLPRHLRFLMDTRTYLEWPSPSSEATLDSDRQNNLEMTVEGPSPKLESGMSEQAMAVFWKRLKEALGDSLYVKEQHALREAEIAIKKSRERDSVMMLTKRPVERLQETSFYT